MLAGLVAVTAGAVPGAAAQTTAEKPPRLKPVDSCSALMRFARRHTSALIVRDAPSTDRRKEPRFADPLGGSPGGESGSGGGGDPDDFSRTNVQEEGIDEPDPVKTDGRYLFTPGGDNHQLLMALDARAETPHVVGSLKLPGDGGAELLVRGERILAITHGESDHDPFESAVILSEVDISNPAAMRVLRTEKVEGELVDARLHGDVARVAVQTWPREIVVEQPADADWSPSERRARRRRAVAKAPLSTWRPTEVIADRTTGVRAERPAVRCNSVRRPREYSGLGMLTVLTIDLARGLPAVDSDAVIAGGDTLYAGGDGVYVATEEWIARDTDLEDLPTDQVTAIHKFAIAGPETRYAASGSVPGYMLDQWSMSEHEGHLRTATTSEPPWWGDEPSRDSESQVVVLAERAGALVEVGRAGGLGRGESIQAVRFMGDRGFVVTFRDIDPLFALDLSVPESPRVAGELKIPGYSSYLHPVGEGLLLGVGQDATEDELRGLQLSLFDVSDMSRPRRLAVHTIADAESEAEWDHHAFLHWPATGLTVLPVDVYGGEDGARQDFAGAIGFRVDTGAHTIEQAGQVAGPPEDNPDSGDSPVRNLVIGDRVFSVWWYGVRVSRLDDLSPGGWVDTRG